jgi:hypothetical protein
MPAHSRLKNGVASLAYVADIHVLVKRRKDVDGRDKPGHDWEAVYSPAGMPSTFSLIL